jgi:hypothetical protein
MQKFLAFILTIAAFAFFPVVILAQTEGSCTPQFSISSPQSVDMGSAPVWVDITVTNTGSCEGSTTVYPLMPDGWFNGSDFTTKTLQPGESDNSTIKIFTSDTNSATIQFAADGANSSQTEIIIGGVAPVENATQANATPVQSNETQPPIITPAANTSVISVPQETQPSQNPNATSVQAPQPSQQQTNETGAAQNQPASSVTGLVTANPASQIAVFAILVFGAGYLTARIKREGFRYRFRK